MIYMQVDLFADAKPWVPAAHANTVFDEPRE